MRIMLPVALLLLLLPGTASALTVQEVVALSKAGVSDEVLLSIIERDKTIFSIDSDQLIALTRDRVSEKLVLAMLHSGRQEPPPPPAPSPAANVTHAVPPDPGAFMFGHGPSRPNTYHEFDQLGLVGPSVVYSAPYFAPFAVPAALAPVPCQPATTSASRTDRTVGLADASGKFVNNGLLPVLAAAGGGNVVCQPAAAPPPPPSGRSVRRPRR
jgi:hypothetical protein